MKFEQAVRNCPALAEAFQRGIQALKAAEKHYVGCANPRRLAGSVDVDSALCRKLPHAARWDYAVGVSRNQRKDRVIWIEIHPASSTGEVKTVLAQLKWLQDWLVENAPDLRDLPADFVWIATGTVAFPANSPQRRQLAAAGIQFAGSRYEIQTA